MLKVLSQLSSSSHWPKEDHHCTQKQLRSLETVVSRVKPEMTPINRKVANLLVRDGYWPSHALVLISRSSDTKPAAPIPEQPGPSSRGASLLDSEHRAAGQQAALPCQSLYHDSRGTWPCRAAHRAAPEPEHRLACCHQEPLLGDTRSSHHAPRFKLTR